MKKPNPDHYIVDPEDPNVFIPEGVLPLRVKHREVRNQIVVLNKKSRRSTNVQDTIYLLDLELTTLREQMERLGPSYYTEVSLIHDIRETLMKEVGRMRENRDNFLKKTHDAYQETSDFTSVAYELAWRLSDIVVVDSLLRFYHSCICSLTRTEWDAKEYNPFEDLPLEQVLARLQVNWDRNFQEATENCLRVGCSTSISHNLIDRYVAAAGQKLIKNPFGDFSAWIRARDLVQQGRVYWS